MYFLLLLLLSCRQFCLFQSMIKSLHFLLGCPGDLLLPGILSLDILTNLSAYILVTCWSHSLLFLLSTHSLIGWIPQRFLFIGFLFSFSSNNCLVFDVPALVSSAYVIIGRTVALHIFFATNNSYCQRMWPTDYEVWRHWNVEIVETYLHPRANVACEHTLFLIRVKWRLVCCPQRILVKYDFAILLLVVFFHLSYNSLDSSRFTW